MPPTLCQHFCWLCVCITIFTQMLAGIVCSDVAGNVTRTFRSRSFPFRCVQPPADSLLIVADPHTAATLSSIARQFIAFCTGLNNHTTGRSDLNHGLPKNQLFLCIHFPCFREVSPHFWIKVNKTDDYRFRIAFQCRRNCLKGAEMVICCIPLRKKNRIVTPANAVHTDKFRKLFEIFKQSVFVRHIRFNVPSIRGDRNKPVLTIFSEQIHIREHWRGILCAEAYHIHDGRVKAIAAYLTRIIGISDTDEAFLQSVCKPLRIEGRDVSSLSCVDNHDAPHSVISQESNTNQENINTR